MIIWSRKVSQWSVWSGDPRNVGGSIHGLVLKAPEDTARAGVYVPHGKEITRNGWGGGRCQVLKEPGVF